MAADSDSRIAWHRVQVRKHRDTLKRIETSKFRVGEIADRKAIELSSRRQSTMRIFSSAEYCFRVARRMSRTSFSAATGVESDFCLIFAIARCRYGGLMTILWICGGNVTFKSL
jgi:hypothetical protein